MTDGNLPRIYTITRSSCCEIVRNQISHTFSIKHEPSAKHIQLLNIAAHMRTSDCETSTKSWKKLFDAWDNHFAAQTVLSSTDFSHACVKRWESTLSLVCRKWIIIYGSQDRAKVGEYLWWCLSLFLRVCHSTSLLLFRCVYVKKTMMNCRWERWKWEEKFDFSFTSCCLRLEAWNERVSNFNGV